MKSSVVRVTMNLGNGDYFFLSVWTTLRRADLAVYYNKLGLFVFATFFSNLLCPGWKIPYNKIMF